jgi:hypothetical protein
MYFTHDKQQLPRTWIAWSETKHFHASTITKGTCVIPVTTMVRTSSYRSGGSWVNVLKSYSDFGILVDESWFESALFHIVKER